MQSNVSYNIGGNETDTLLLGASVRLPVAWKHVNPSMFLFKVGQYEFVTSSIAIDSSVRHCVSLTSQPVRAFMQGALQQRELDEQPEPDVQALPDVHISRGLSKSASLIF